MNTNSMYSSVASVSSETVRKLKVKVNVNVMFLTCLFAKMSNIKNENVIN